MSVMHRCRHQSLTHTVTATAALPPCVCVRSAKLSDPERAQLAAYLVEKKFNDKDRIITQGELGLGFYIIAKVAEGGGEREERWVSDGLVRQCG